MTVETRVIGQPLDRVDGRQKVTGSARYSADIPAANVAYAVLITSTIASGRVRQMDTQEAERLFPASSRYSLRLRRPACPAAALLNRERPMARQGSQAARARRSPRKPAPVRAEGRVTDNSRARPALPPDRMVRVGSSRGRRVSRRASLRTVRSILLQEDDVFYNGQPIGPGDRRDARAGTARCFPRNGALP